MTIEQRLERLERRNRWLTFGICSVIVAAVVACGSGQAKDAAVPEVVRAKAFHVVTDDGTVLIKLEDCFGLHAFPPPNGQELMHIGTIGLFDEAGVQLVMLGASTDGNGLIRTMNRDGFPVTRIGSKNDGYGIMAVYDPTGTYERGMLTPERR